MLNKYTFPVALLVLSSCANIVQPGGGPVDQQAPVVVKETPANATTSFNVSTFTVCFDEYIQLKEPQKNVVISPPVGKPPAIQISGKCVEVVFEKNTLLPNTTYHVQFLGAIADIHENTVLYDYGYMFSTGAGIDTLSMAGVVVDSRTLKKMPGYVVGLYRNYTDSSAFKQKPDYVAMTNVQGVYRFKAISMGQYRLVAFEDKNANLMADGGEEVALSDAEYSPVDSLRNLKLYSFTQPLYSPGKLVDTLNSALQQFELVFYKPAYKALISDGLFGFHKQDDTWDTLLVQSFSATAEQTITWNMPTGQNQIHVINKAENKPVLSIQHQAQPFYSGDTICLTSSNSIQNIRKDSILIKTDSVYKPAMVVWGKNKPTLQLIVNTKDIKNNVLRVHIGKGAISDKYGQENVPSDFVVPVLNESDFGSLEFTVKNSKAQTVVVELLDEKYRVMYSKQVKSSQKVQFNRIKPGTYLVRGVLDANANGIWDGGNLSNGTMAERVIYLSTSVILRADWLIEGNTLDFDMVK